GPERDGREQCQECRRYQEPPLHPSTAAGCRVRQRSVHRRTPFPPGYCAAHATLVAAAKDLRFGVVLWTYCPQPGDNFGSGPSASEVESVTLPPLVSIPVRGLGET